MNNLTVVTIYIPLAIITAGILIAGLVRRFKRSEHLLFILLCCCTLCWYIAAIAGLLTKNVETAKFLLDFVNVFVGFIPPLLLLFIMEFYRIRYQLTGVMKVLLFLIPVINMAITLTAKHHTLVNRQLEIISLSPVREVVLEWGPWFWVHTLYSYLISMVIIGIILLRHFQIARFYRIPSTMMVVGVSITLVGNAAYLFQLFPIAIDPTLITMNLSLIFFDLAILNNNNSKFVRFSQGQIFHYLKEYILILDENRRIVDYNRPAGEWFAAQNISLNASFDDVLDALYSKKNTVQKKLEIENETDIYLDDGVFAVTLNLRMEKVTDVRGDEIGSLAVFTDVTQNRMLIERLEARAGMDSLTGLANHMAYEGAKNRLNAAPFLPLSVIMCDANSLKSVNDTLGHQYGDMMLQTVADVLYGVCPADCFVGRIGGDEFVYLLPNTPLHEAEALMDDVRAGLESCKKTPFPLSVALGAAAKTDLEEDLNQVIALADTRMYEDKKIAKAGLNPSRQGDYPLPGRNKGH